MKKDDLTKAEQELIQRLPGPPVAGYIRATQVRIVEWLSPNEPQTGLTLHEWMNDRHPGWSAYSLCETKQDVFAAIELATSRANQSGMIPVLHLEAHGGHDGLEGPDGRGSTEFLSWDELIKPLQRLNLATHCNLVVVVAACTGFAGIQALTRGPLAPAVALVGPDAPVMPRNLLAGTKEFYRRWMDKSPRLQDLATSASREAGTVGFEVEPFVILAYDALVKQIVISARPDEHQRRKERIRQRMQAEDRMSATEIERRLALLPQTISGDEIQRLWDKMFMIDLYPENRERFGVDMNEVVKLTAHI
jgi:hypothetical protein